MNGASACRVAVQAAVLRTLRQATGGDDVWPTMTMSELALRADRLGTVAAGLAHDLQLKVTPADVEAAWTAEDLIDALARRSGAEPLDHCVDGVPVALRNERVEPARLL